MPGPPFGPLGPPGPPGGSGLSSGPPWQTPPPPVRDKPQPQTSPYVGNVEFATSVGAGGGTVVVGAAANARDGLLVFIACNSALSTVAVSDNQGNVYQRGPSQTADDALYSYWVPSLKAANPTITVSSFGSANPIVGVVQIVGANPNWFVDQCSVVSGTAHTFQQPVSTVAPNDLIVGANITGGAGAVTWASGYSAKSMTLTAPGGLQLNIGWSTSPLAAHTVGPTTTLSGTINFGDVAFAIRTGSNVPSDINAPPNYQQRPPWMPVPSPPPQAWAQPVQTSFSITPPAGTITLASVGSVMNLGIAPPAGAITLTGLAPVMNLGIAPAAGTITLTGYGSVLNLGIAPLIGTITLTGYGPVMNLGITPPAGAIVLSGQAPTVISGLVTLIAPPAGAITLSGAAPAVAQGTVTTPGAGAITLTGVAPVLILGTVIAPTVGAVTLNGVAVTLNLGIVPGAWAITLSGQLPTITVPGAIFPPAGALALAGAAPAMNLGIAPGAGATALAGAAPGDLDLGVAPQPGAIALQGYAPGVSIGGGTSVAITPPAGAVALAGQVSPQNLALFPNTGGLLLIGAGPPGLGVPPGVPPGYLLPLQASVAALPSGLYLEPEYSGPLPLPPGLYLLPEEVE